jgi:hypothetical protein
MPADVFTRIQLQSFKLFSHPALSIHCTFLLYSCDDIHHGDLKIINASLFRMATKSMAQAFIILRIKTHHGLLEDVTETPWSLIEQAAEATWPHVPNATARPPHQRADWQAIWGYYDAVTDIASPFAPKLIKTYPEAKVIVVQRDFESWWPSFRSQLRDTVLK